MSHHAHDLRAALVARLLGGTGHASTAARHAAFDARPHDPRADALVARVARHAWTVEDEHVAAALRGGLTEDEVFELVVCAAVGQATRQIDGALAALEAATGDDAPRHTEPTS